MNKQTAIKLKNKAKQVAEHFSNKDREFNFTGEKFNLVKIIPLSELTAAVFYGKSSGKHAVFFFYWRKDKGGHWEYFVPTDSHIIGMESFGKYKKIVEERNWQYNFGEENDRNPN